MKYVNLLLLLLLTACGGGGSEDTDTVPQKQSHPGFKILDITQTFAPQLAITTNITGKIGTISYQVAEGAADDVLQISTDKQGLSVLNAGSTEVIAIDSGNNQYLPGRIRFNVTVEKAPRAPILTNDLSLIYQEATRHQAFASGALGELEYELSADQSDQVVLIDLAGEFLIWGSGTVSVDVTDDGGRNYQQDTQKFNITIEPASSLSASFKDIKNKPFVIGAKLLPVYSGAPAQVIHYSLVKDTNSNVVKVDSDTGEMSIIGAGTTEIQVQQEALQHHSPIAMQRFKVQINQASNLELQVQDIIVQYSVDTQYEIPVSAAKGTLHFAVTDNVNNDIINIIDDVKGLFSFESIGETQVTVTDSGNQNYASSSKVINIKVTRINDNSLNSLAIESRYQANSQLLPQVIGVHGQLHFNLTDNSATDVVLVEPNTGKMTILKPGKVEVLVTDDGGDFWEKQQKTFSVSIDKKTNTTLLLTNTRIDYTHNATFTPTVLNNKGSMSFTIDNSGDHVFNQDSTTGIITLVGAGRGWITAVDAGDDYYHSVTERFFVDVSPLSGSLSIASIRIPYSSERELDIPISGSIGQLQWQFKHGQTDVVSINETARTLTIHNAGNATFIVTDPGDAGHLPQKAEFNIIIDKAVENSELALTNKLITGEYSPDGKLAAPTIIGRGPNSQISYYGDLQAANVVIANTQTGELSVKGAGLVQVSVIEESRNFERTIRSFSVNIEKAKHPGLEIDNINQQVIFYPDRNVEAPTMDNQFGELTFRFPLTVSPEFAELHSNGDIKLHTYAKSGENAYLTIEVNDDGGQNYKPASITYKLHVAGIKSGLGEEATISFDAADKQIISPISIAANEVSYFSAFGGRKELKNHDTGEQSTGYSTMTVLVCKDPATYKGCTLVTLRLQNTSHCSDGSQVGFPITSKSIHTCPGLTQPVSSEVTVSLNKSDPFNAWFTEPGRYQTRTPIVLVHFAKPYRPGGVIEYGDIQSRAWWLINLDITNN
ncbi:hypothetical protein CXF83_03585 [Shewanella sp. Choline-02u-19]|uniref:hypothetical protein n=1 Tax=unclassified Shewanella TaxID=196818 RepID=UPI000C3487FC|nr:MULTISPECIES: hypothetical protein [unclassified Shewanella]PKG56699.1 hypothetical protein CXF82_13285 [Shewanella sp. GutDb-MelDb]PKH57834.1 hypothetical protein CXF84_07590 [Shewanella sp. Bg11-22]PKI29747.1 hypothetical protein CXF83_03585 [Shewanella sp. Choline-02u-19]